MANLTIGARFMHISDEQYNLINDSKKGYNEFVKYFEEEHRCIVQDVKTEFLWGLKWAKIMYRNA